MKTGWVGVDLFFVLSGFLVSGLLFNEYRTDGMLRIKRFLIRRGMKIYPPFYVLLLTTVCLVAVLGSGSIPTKVLFSEFLLVQNYGPAFWGHTWSLAVEEHFYLILALTLFILMWRAGKQVNPFSCIPWLAVAIILILPLLRILTALYVVPYSLKTHHFPTHLRLDSLTFGVLLSYLHHFRHDEVSGFVRHHLKAITLLSCILVSSCLVFEQASFVMSTIGYTFLYIGFGGLLLVSVYGLPKENRPYPRVLTAIGTALAFVGTNSYGIYLWHLPVANWGFMLLRRLYRPLDYRLEFVIYVLASIAVGVLMTKLVERPSLWLRERIFPSRGRSVSHFEPPNTVAVMPAVEA
jgi:peptidoglycan/LPS O-acetylase OafA/YrhL